MRPAPWVQEGALLLLRFDEMIRIDLTPSCPTGRQAGGDNGAGESSSSGKKNLLFQTETVQTDMNANASVYCVHDQFHAVL